MKRKTLIGIIICLNIVLCVSVLLFVRLVTDGGLRLDRKLDLGNKYLLNMDYEKALRAFTDAIDIDPMADAAYTGRGDTYLAMGDYENAWDDYEKAQEITGDDSICESKFGRTEFLVTDASGAPLPDASVSLANENRTYLMQTDSRGTASEVICPADYRMSVSRDGYVGRDQDVQVGYEQRRIDTVVMEPDDPNIEVTDSLNAYVQQQSFMYGNSYTITARMNYGTLIREYGDLPAGGYMGYAIEDFDGDGVSELCIAGLDGEYAVQIIMYEYVGGQVVEQSRQILEYTDMMGSFTGETFAGGWNAEVSLFTTVLNGRIYIIADEFELEAYFADGTSRRMTRLSYDGQNLVQDGMADGGGSSYETEEVQRFEREASAIGAVNPNHIALVQNTGAFAYQYFENADEFVHNEFFTVNRFDMQDYQTRGADGTWRCADRDDMHHS